MYKINRLPTLLKAMAFMTASVGYAALAFGAAEATDPVVRELLSESIPTAFAPLELGIQDFRVDQGSSVDSQLFVELEPGSLEWVRVDDVLVLPRARLRIRIKNAQSGLVRTGGKLHTLVAYSKGSGVRGVVPIALISGNSPSSNPIEISWLEHGVKKSSTLHLQFRPQNKKPEDRIALDPSCSKFNLESGFATQPHENEWVYIGCKRVVTQASQGRVNSLDLIVFWEGVREASVAGVAAEPVAASVWNLRTAAQPGKLELVSSNSALDLHYKMASRFHLGSFSLGMGPYSYQFNSGQLSSSTIAPILTLYGSFTVSDTSRFVMFDAAALSSNSYNDLGVYFSSETVRALDQRVSVRLMVGGHLMSFNSNQSRQIVPGFPQGFELSLGDAFRRGQALSAGAFIYPNINGKAYDNIWLRWGSSYFGELNYISFLETPDGQRTYSRSLGLTFGIPLFGFL